MTSTFITIDIFGKLRMYEYSDGKDDNFMTIVVLFQLIFLNIRRKFIVFRDLSPNRPFQELNNIQLLTAHY